MRFSSPRSAAFRQLRDAIIKHGGFQCQFFRFRADVQLLLTVQKNDTIRVAILKCCNLEVVKKIVHINKETGFSVVMLH